MFDFLRFQQIDFIAQSVVTEIIIIIKLIQLSVQNFRTLIHTTVTDKRVLNDPGSQKLSDFILCSATEGTSYSIIKFIGHE